MIETSTPSNKPGSPRPFQKRSVNKVFEDKETAAAQIDGYRKSRENLNLPGPLGKMPLYLTSFVLSAYPDGLPKNESEALDGFRQPEGDKRVVQKMAKELSAFVSGMIFEQEEKSRGNGPLSEEERRMIDAVFPNGVPSHLKENPSLLVREATARIDYPGLGELNAREREFVAAKIVNGWGDDGRSPDVLFADAQRIQSLQDRLSLLGGGKSDNKLKEEIVRLGGDPDPNADLRFGIKALMGLTAISLAVANPLLAVGAVALAAKQDNRTVGR